MPALSLAQRTRGSRISALMTWAYLAHLSLHFLVPPLLLLSPGLLAGKWTEAGLHRPLIVVMISASTIILTWGWRHHRHVSILWWGGIGGLCMLASTWVIGLLFSGHHAGLIVATVGSLLLAVAHWHNHQLWRQLAIRTR